VFDFFAEEFLRDSAQPSRRFVRYFHSASLKGEESAGLYLMGPVGSGKSSLVERVQRGLEQVGLIYAIEGCR